MAAGWSWASILGPELWLPCNVQITNKWPSKTNINQGMFMRVCYARACPVLPLCSKFSGALENCDVAEASQIMKIDKDPVVILKYFLMFSSIS